MGAYRNLWSQGQLDLQGRVFYTPSCSLDLFSVTLGNAELFQLDVSLDKYVLHLKRSWREDNNLITVLLEAYY